LAREKPGAATLTVTGEDVSYLLDREEVDAEHPALTTTRPCWPSSPLRGRRYRPGGHPADGPDPPLPIDRIPTQHGTDGNT
jgi:hypothetical protein